MGVSLFGKNNGTNEWLASSTDGFDSMVGRSNSQESLTLGEVLKASNYLS